MKPWCRFKGRKKLLLLAMLPVVVIAAYALYLIATHNFHTVVPGQVYRSSEMSGPAFQKTIQQYGIKTIVNLRGANPGSAWYQSELEAAKLFRVEHYDFRLSARQEVSVAELDQIVSTLSAAPKPILIHCQAGSDRAGLICAIYCLRIEKQPPSLAAKQLTFWYGHIPVFETIAMDHSFWNYVSNQTTPMETNVLPDSITR